MNERIKELLAQCTDSQMTKPWPLVDTEKFAELLVRECADTCLKMAYSNPGSHHYAVMLKEHFGVE